MRTINIGKLNKRVTFLRFEDGTDAMGQTIQKLTEIKTVWASFNAIKGAEYYEVQKAQGETSHKCHIRYLQGIDANCYVKYREKIYAIESVVNLEDKMLEIRCKERLNKETQNGGFEF